MKNTVSVQFTAAQFERLTKAAAALTSNGTPATVEDLVVAGALYNIDAEGMDEADALDTIPERLTAYAVEGLAYRNPNTDGNPFNAEALTIGGVA